MALRREWKIDRPTRKCSACKAGFSIGQKYFSAIYPLGGGGMIRREFCPSCWPRFRDGDVPPLDAPPDDAQPMVLAGAYISFWKSAVPEPPPKNRPLRFNPQVALTVFRQAADGDDSPEKQRLRFILALSLVRHKVLKLKNIERSSDGGFMVLSDRSGTESRVCDIGLGEQEILALMDSIAELLDMSFNDDERLPAGDEAGQLHVGDGDDALHRHG